MNGTLDVMDGAQAVLNSFSPAISFAFYQARDIVNTSVDQTMNSVNFDALVTSGLSTNMGITNVK